jgi:hypothetical protein
LLRALVGRRGANAGTGLEGRRRWALAIVCAIGRFHLCAVGATAGVVKGETSARGAADQQPTSMNGAMMGAAQKYESFGVVCAAFGSRKDVVGFDEAVMAAAGHGATSVVSAKDAAADGGWNGLGGAGDGQWEKGCSGT